jgi:hypothetical protein
MTRLATFERKLKTLESNLIDLDVRIIEPSRAKNMKDNHPTMIAALQRRQDITAQIAAVTQQIKSLQPLAAAKAA